MPKPLKIIILAGSYRQFEQYLFENHISQKDGYDYVYGGNIFAILRVKASQVVVYGTFWDREDANELYRTAHTRLVEDKASIKKVEL